MRPLSKHHISELDSNSLSLFIWAFLKLQLSLLHDITLLFSCPQTNQPPRSTITEQAWQTFTVRKLHQHTHTLLLCFCGGVFFLIFFFSPLFMSFFPPKLGRCWCVRGAKRQPELLEAEAKFTSPRCHRCRSASSVVMVTLVMREGLLSEPEGQAQFLRARC